MYKSEFKYSSTKNLRFASKCSFAFPICRIQVIWGGGTVPFPPPNAHFFIGVGLSSGFPKGCTSWQTIRRKLGTSGVRPTGLATGVGSLCGYVSGMAMRKFGALASRSVSTMPMIGSGGGGALLFYFLFASPPCPDHALCPATPLPICLRHIPWAPDSSFSKAFTRRRPGRGYSSLRPFQLGRSLRATTSSFKILSDSIITRSTFASKSRYPKSFAPV